MFETYLLELPELSESESELSLLLESELLLLELSESVPPWALSNSFSRFFFSFLDSFASSISCVGSIPILDDDFSSESSAYLKF